MRILFFMLLFAPLIAVGNEAPNEKTLSRLQKLCREDTTPELRKLYCQLAKDYRREKKRMDSVAEKDKTKEIEKAKVKEKA
ncbi:hypothetical protein [Legionella rowbothamii]|uniref:hypothetical protein n=1 Tax=Legionella rowbothamii TaxID=96229 RepID=UPI0010564A54|nr:hypothetical protein [Legionella rowbothamii]